MPTPEELGLRRPAEEPTDWSQTHRRLDRLGATCLHLERLPSGDWRFTCLLPTAKPSQSHRVEAEAATDAAAVRLVLEEAERWAAAR